MAQTTPEAYSGPMRCPSGFTSRWIALSAGIVVIAGSRLPAQRVADLPVTVTARSQQPGELVALTVTTPDSTEALTARAFGHSVATYPVEATTWRVLVGIDLDTAPGRYPVTIEAKVGGRSRETSAMLDVRAKAFPTRQLTVAESFVNPPASEDQRIAAEAARLTALWKVTTPKRLWDAPFVRPVTDPANSAFGSRSVFNGEARAPHSGADFLSPAGTVVRAPAGGKVVLAGSLYFTGNTVILDHGLGLYSLFAHFSEIAVQEGDVVAPGDVLGKVGATGRVTGPHLHWAVRADGARVDPLSVVAVLSMVPGAH